VTADVLSVANGAVRCGSCLRVFNAKDYLLNENLATIDHSSPLTNSTTDTPGNVDAITQEPPTTATKTSHKEHSALPANGGVAFSTHPSANDEVDESWAVKLLKESEKTEAALANNDTTDNLIFVACEDDAFYDNADDLLETSFVAPPPSNKGGHASNAKSVANTQQEKVVDPTESLFIEIINNDLDDNDTTPPHTDHKPLDLLLDDAPTPIETNEQNTATDDDGSWADDLLADENSAPDAILISSTPQPAKADSNTTTDANINIKVQTGDDTSNTLKLDFERDSITFSEEKPLSIRWPWAIGSVLLIATLLGQSAWLKLNEWSIQPAYRSYYEKTCAIIGCQLPERFDITQIRLTHLVVRSHPDQKNALIVDAIIVNHAQFEQPFPGIHLLFLDIQGKLVASRIFQPSEYVKGELFGQTVMPASQSIQLSLPIADPGDKAVNYRLEMTPAATKN
jgi:hypothetical protein